MLRNIPKEGQMRNVKIREEIGTTELFSEQERKHLQWSGHVKRMDDGIIPKKVFELKLEGRRSLGRPWTRLTDQVREDISEREFIWEAVVVEKLWDDLNRWRLFTHQPAMKQKWWKKKKILTFLLPTCHHYKCWQPSWHIPPSWWLYEMVFFSYMFSFCLLVFCLLLFPEWWWF